MQETKCCVPEPQMREVSESLLNGISRACDLAISIEDKLFGNPPVEARNKENNPGNVRYFLNRSDATVGDLINKLESINSKL